jgi:hypothetical protein
MQGRLPRHEIAPPDDDDNVNTASPLDEITPAAEALGFDPDAAQDAISNALGSLGAPATANDEPDVALSGAGNGIDTDGGASLSDEGPPQAETDAPADEVTPAPAPPTAPAINVTPEMVAAFKAENPLFAQMDDATAGAALSDILTSAIEAEKANPSTQPDKPGYSLWNDIKSVPGAIGAGVAKSGFETYDAVNEMVLGNEYDPSEWRQGIENYYANTSGISGAAAVVAQFGAAFVGFGKFAKLAKIPGLARAAATRTGQAAQAATVGAAADFLAFDGLDKRLSDMVQQYPSLQNPVNEFLASKPGDTQLEGRLKNALEGLGIGTTVDVVLAGFRAMRAHRAGDKAGVEAAVDEGVAKFDELDGGPSPAQQLAADSRALPSDAEAVTPRRATEDVSSEAQGQELRAANDDPNATPQAMGDTSQPQQQPGSALRAAEDLQLQADNDTLARIDEALAPSLPRSELEAAASRMAQRVAEDPTAPLITPEIGQATPSTFDSLNKADDLRAIVDATEKEILKNLEGSASSKGSVSIEESQRLAKEFAEMTGQDQGHFYIRMSRDAGSIENLHARLLAYDQVTRTLAVEVRDMAHAIKAKEPGTYGSLDLMKDAFENKLAAYAQVQDWLKGVRSETGRTLAIMRHSQRLGQGIDVSNIAAFGQGRGKGPWGISVGPVGRGNITVEELADAVLVAGTDRKMLREIASPTRYAMVRDALVSLYIKNILSGPTTHLVNTIGNLSTTLAHPATKILGGAMSRDMLTMREGVKQYGFMVSESAHALSMAFEALKRGENILDPAISKHTVDGKYREALSAHNISGGMVSDDSITGYVANLGFKAIDAVSTRALSASDEFFKQTLYASELTARAWADGVSQGLKGDALAAYITQQRDAGFAVSFDGVRNTANATSEAGQAALEVARFNTFTSNVKPGGLASSLLSQTNKYPELKFAVPFVRVISNLMTYTGNMTPGVNLLMSAYKDAIARGGRDAAVAKGRVALGGALWLSALNMAAGGQITGAGPTKSDGSPDYKKRQMLEQSGWKAYSVKVGDTYFSLNRLDPFGLPFVVAATAMERFRVGVRDAQAWEDTALMMGISLGHVMLDKQYMKGLADFFEAMNDDTGRKANAYFARLAANIAIPNFVNQAVTQRNDNLMREARGFVETLMKRTPLASEDLSARRMPWGEKMTLQPHLYGNPTDDPVMQEYARLLETGESGAGEPLPRMKVVPGGKSIDMTRFILSNGESLYDAYGDLVEQPDPSMAPLKEVLQELIDSDEYKNEMIDGPGAFHGTRLKAWQTIMARYRATAWRVILDEYPEVRERVLSARTDTAEALAQRQSTVDPPKLDDVLDDF